MILSGKTSKRQRRADPEQSLPKTSNPVVHLAFSSWERWGFWIAGLLALFTTIGLRTHSYWAAYFSNGRDRSWDGSGHVALLQIYDKTVFPDTFGWTNAYFSGMPFPNFYPPLWYWSIAALHHAGAPLFLTYKLVVLGSMLLIPLALARLTFVLTDSLASSAATSILCLIPMLEKDMMPRYAAGLTFASTFNEGIYTEPIGFLLLILTITSLLQASDLRSSLLTGLLLSGSLLGNLFTFVSALPFFIAYCLYPVAKRRSHLFRVLIASTTALFLTAFWTVPVLTHYKYFVTSPVRPSLHEVIAPAMWVWLGIGLGCAAWSLLRADELMKKYLIGLLLLVVGWVCAYIPGLENLPLQPPRLIAIVSILLTVPIASTVQTLVDVIISSVPMGLRTKRSVAVALLSVSVCFAALLPLCSLEISIRAQGSPDMDALLEFAKLHNDGRYMVQTPHSHRDRFEARALSSYLGSQGNEAATVVFRESALSSIFYVPLENKVSSLQQAFGISSSLDNDSRFLDESANLTASQLQELGVRYLMRLRKEEWRRSASGTTVLNAGRWEVLKLPLAPAPEVESLTVRPALLFSDISYKERRVGQFDANRIFEEQFRAGDYFRRIALSPAPAIDEMDHLDSFGVLILNKFTVRDEDTAFALIKEFSQTKPVIVIPDSSTLCHRLLSHRDQLPGIAVIEIDKAHEGAWLDEHGTDSPQREQITAAWKRIAEALGSPNEGLSQKIGAQTGDYRLRGSAVLIHRSFDPSWRSQDGFPVYLSGPSATLVLSKNALPFFLRRAGLEESAKLASLLSALCAAALLAERVLRSRLVAARAG